MPPVNQPDLVAGVRGRFAEVLNVETVAEDDDFFDAGGTSLSGALLIALLQRQLGLPVSLTDLYAAPTAAALAERLCDKGSAEPDAGPDPVFIVHVNTAEVAREIARHRPAVVLSCGLTTQFETDGWPPPVGVQALAERYVAELRGTRLDGPYHLMGYSLGGIIAWEMAQQLTDAGAQVGLLCLIDSAPPEFRYRPIRLRAVLVNLARTPSRTLASKVRRRLMRRMSKVPLVGRPLWRRSDYAERMGMIDHRLGSYPMKPLLHFGGRLLLVDGSDKSSASLLFQPPPALGAGLCGVGSDSRSVSLGRTRPES